MIDYKELANAIRFLSIDAVEQAKSGHPGMPLGMAEIATVLWHRFLKHSPENPYWFNRDRFVLSNGHGSMLLYSLLHLTGYELSINDLKQFRQLHSKTPGHPEYQHTPGVETTTGPLGQGLANAVGMALAEKHLAACFNRPNLPLVNHFTYAFVGDGCLMEGISHEACSLAGALKLGKLIVFYDDNEISIDGHVSGWYRDDVCKRFEAYDWHVIGPIDGHDPKELASAIEISQLDYRPSLIICKTKIGNGSPKEGSADVHGAPLGAAAVSKTRETFGWQYGPFEIPANIYESWSHRELGKKEEATWLLLCAEYQKLYPDVYKTFLQIINGDLPDDFDDSAQALWDVANTQDKPMATRLASQKCLDFWIARISSMIGGSADLTGSNLTNALTSRAITPEDASGNYIHYGVREFSMAAIMNGLALHGGVIPYGGTFLVFSDYARNAIRMSALMGTRVIYVLTHDSIGLGEDGPTHQPIEHLAMLRATPNIDVWRPADWKETAVAWQSALAKSYGPSCIALSRQALPIIEQQNSLVFNTTNILRGGYVVLDTSNLPEFIILSTGSELHLAIEAGKLAQARGLAVRVVSMPCIEKFLEQPISYQEEILPSGVRRRLAIEAGCTHDWYRFVGLDGKVLGIDAFGVSAPAKDAYEHFGLTVEAVLNTLITWPM